MISSKVKSWIGEGQYNLLRVCSDTNQGMRKYMEDEVSVVIEEEKTSRTAYLAVFDGHGGKEASVYARDNLYRNIIEQSGFTSEDPELVKNAIREGFIKTHWDMFRVVESWPKRKDGQNSTSGTTATVAIIRGNRLYIAHVGDSAAVIATKKDNNYVSSDLTIDHKPENKDEKSRIEGLGGYVAKSNGVPRVVWKRAVQRSSPGNNEPQTSYEYVPFLAVSRALGDVWSYDNNINKFIVSPEPDIKHIDLLPGFHKFMILASDGLWGVMTGKDAVDVVTHFETSSNYSPSNRNSSEILINRCLNLWQKKRSRADNISAIVVFFDDELACLNGPSEEDIETDVVVSDNEDDTPPLIRTSSSISLVEQLAFYSCKFPVDSFPVVLPTVATAASANDSPLFRNLRNDDDVAAYHKRKVGDKGTSSPSIHESRRKRARAASPVDSVVEDSHQSNVLTTVLSSESLCELQLDEDLGLADDENDDKNLIETQKVRRLSSRRFHGQVSMKKVSPAVHA